MADLTRTQAQVKPATLDAESGCVRRTVISGVAITPGQATYFAADGDAELADGSAAGTAKVRGIALKQVSAGQPVSILLQGPILGWDLSGLAYGADVFLSDTAGELADAAGTVSVKVGTVWPLSDTDRTKVLYVNIPAVM